MQSQEVESDNREYLPITKAEQKKLGRFIPKDYSVHVKNEQRSVAKKILKRRLHNKRSAQARMQRKKK